MHFGERIRQAREIRGWTQEQLASEMNKHKSLIAQVEAGFRLPSDDFLETVALATKLPLTFFNEEPHEEFPLSEVLFRAPRDIKRREVLDAVRYAEHIFSIYARVSKRLKEVPVKLPELPCDPVQAARQTKDALGIPEDASLRSLLRPLERAGVVFIASPQMPAGDAFSVWVSASEGKAVPVIVYSTDKGTMDRTRLSISHELGHLVMHRSFLRKVHSEIEDEAFTFAAEWLLPEAAMRREIRDPVTLTSMAKLKPVWGVSVAALIKRAYDLKLITQRHYHYLFQQLAKEGWKTREPESLDIPVERPRLFRKMVEVVYGKPINFVGLAGDTHITAQELRKILAGYEEGVSGGAEDHREHGSKVIQFSR